MKKYIIIFILFSGAAMLYLLLSTNQEKGFISNPKKSFVSIKGKKFSLNEKDFYPIAVNYITSVMADKNGLWVRPYSGYAPDSELPCMSKDSCLMELKADMELIKEMGFNSIRIVGAGEENINKKTGELSINASIDARHDTVIPLINGENYNKYLSALGELFNIANNAGLKIIFLIKTAPEIMSTEDHLRRLAVQFRNDTGLMAYDLFNEPLYFDSLERNKMDIIPITKKWKKIMKMYAPNQLCTIGLEGIREMFEWDANLVQVDFVSLHPYEFEPEQVRNELYWYGHYIHKPWIIGETALPADNDSVTYEEQKSWAHNTLKQAYNCGASGYSWWQFKDVDWHAYRANFMGVVTRKGTIKTSKSNVIVKGTVKPVAEEFKKFDPAGKKDSCICLSNYYNYSQHHEFRVAGRLADNDNNPIQGGIVLAWSQYWTYSFHTVSKADGSFELLGNQPFYHWIATGTLYTTVRGELQPNTAKKYNDTIPTVRLGNIKLQKLPIEE